MLREILLGLLIAGILLYLFYLYLEWCSKYASAKVLYETNPLMVMKNDKAVIESYGKFMLPEYLSDTYKPIRFWMLYYKAKYL
jgi:hypothetical protein